MALIQDKTLVKVLMVQGEKGDKGDSGEITNLPDLLEALEDVVYTKTEIDENFLDETEIINGFYSKAQTYDKSVLYTKAEVNQLIQNLTDSISSLIGDEVCYKPGDTITIPNNTNGRIRCAGYISESAKHLRVTVPTKPIAGNTITINNLYISVRLTTGGYGFIQCDADDSYNIELGAYGQQLIADGNLVVDEDTEADYLTVVPLITNGQMTLLFKFKYALRRNQGDYVATNNTPVAFDIAGDFIVS